ncbi:MAG: hypothetical protein J0M18_06140 [Ignavibacteria bacterium]|jgi:predicted Fe-Mo cluster-binding NifX family protein|nr:hypothetical protein [Ignavibacteria bacterium]
MDKEPINLYDKNDDPMMWELREIKIKMGKRKITAEEINKNAEEILKKHGIKLRTLEHTVVSEKQENYKKKKD